MKLIVRKLMLLGLFVIKEQDFQVLNNMRTKLKIYNNMGHSLPDHVIPEMVSEILGHLSTKPKLASSE